ncbi:MAG: rhomboid family intramembrane serine protease [Fibrobacterota bacterium]
MDLPYSGEHRRLPGYLLIILACTALAVVQTLLNLVHIEALPGGEFLSVFLSLSPVHDPSIVYRLFTYAFVHDGMLHLIFNMVALLFLGRALEEEMGKVLFLRLYCAFVLFCGLFTALHSYLYPFSTGAPVVGASGAIAALLFLFWRKNPDASILVFFVLPMPVRYFMVAVIAFDFIGTLFPIRTGIAHATHLGGYLVGYLYLYQLPRFQLWNEGRHTVKREMKARAAVETELVKSRYYEDQIDPILKKISEQGMGALSDFERHILKKAGKLK